MYRDSLPLDDSAYFENLTHCIFQAGLNWKMIANKWPGFTEAFAGFDIEKVAGFGDEDVERLMGDTGIVRNRRKILATIENARTFSHVGDSTANIFIHTVGEDIKHTP
jgi:DNA-3-methyladenine glycosylase I